MTRLVVLAAVLAAAVLPTGPPGAGVVAVALLVIGAVAASARAAATLDRRRALYLCLAALLATPAALRDAGWVVAIDLVASWVFVALATTGPRLEAVFVPFEGIRELRAHGPRSLGGKLALLRALMLTLLVLVPFGALFWSADDAFAAIASDVPVPDLSTWPARALTLVFVLLSGFGLVRAARHRPSALVAVRRPRLSSLESFVPLAALNLLFLAFVAIQATVLFGGNAYVLETSGLSYAAYARRGFWELLAVAALTAIVIAAAQCLCSQETRGDRLRLRLSSLGLCASTLVIVASALYRLDVYEDAFGLTRLRLGADVGAVWLGGLFAAGGVAIATGRLRRLGPVVATGTAALLLAFSLANPDARIAQRNIGRESARAPLDTAYLSGLSADAAGVLARLPEPTRSSVLAGTAERLRAGDPWGSWNLARVRARTLLTGD